MLARYVLADLVRNPRRTLSTMIGVTLGVALFCGVLFFVDGLSASMTQRAVAPLPIDMQRIVTERVGGTLDFSQRFDPPGPLAAGAAAHVHLEVHNAGAIVANEVTVRSVPGTNLRFVAGSGVLDGSPITEFADNPFAHGAGTAGLNLGTIEPGITRSMSYIVEAIDGGSELSDAVIRTSYSTRESVNPIGANQPPSVSLAELATMIGRLDGVAAAAELSLADLGSATLSAGSRVAPGPAKIFGFDAGYAAGDATIDIVAGEMNPTGAVVSAEVAEALDITVGATVRAVLPDGSSLERVVSGIADLSRARSLFASRRGSDLESFIYTPNSMVVSPEVFAEVVHPSFQRAAAAREGRLKSPPVREVDIELERQLLDADPGSAVLQTERIAAAVNAVAEHQDFLLDNISNTLTVASADAQVAKRLFVFLGVPGATLAAMLAAYAGAVLADAQRREQATLRIRGASRRHLLRMLTLRTGLLTAAGSAFGLTLGYVAASLILGQDSLGRASTSSLVTSAVLGTLGGFLATGIALYVTGRRSIERDISEDRAVLARRLPLWRRARFDIIGLAVVLCGTVVALRARAFDGAAGSVYFGRAVKLNLVLLILPIAVWITGSLLAARIFGTLLARTQPQSTDSLGHPLPSLYRRSVGRRPWAIGNGAVVVSLIVALATNLAGFTASYDVAKEQDARFANGSDIRVTPSPASQRPYTAGDAGLFVTDGVAGATPVIYGIHNVILRSARTSDPANMVAIDPEGFAAVAPMLDDHFRPAGVASSFQMLARDPTALLLSVDMAAFLKAAPGDRLFILLARGTDRQIEVEMHVSGLFERMAGFPDGADALMSIGSYLSHVPSKNPDFFLAAAESDDAAGLERALTSLQRGPGAVDSLQFDTRLTTLASDQSSLAALNIAGLIDLDSGFALAMAVVTIAIFVFGLLLQRRREYITLRAQGLEPRTIRLLITAEAGTLALGGTVAGLLVGAAMGYYFVAVLRPLFVLDPPYLLPLRSLATPVALVIVATIASSIGASRLVNRLEPTELLRDE